MEQKIFRRASRTFFFSSLLFPRSVRRDVFALYSFLRVADDYVDCQPAQPEKLRELEYLWHKHSIDLDFLILHRKNDSLNLRLTKNIIRLSRQYDFDDEWITSFLAAMKSDVKGSTFHAQKDVLVYVYGSAEVVGLMMSRILGLPKRLDEQARLQGRAWQWLNFIRDIDEDNGLDRCYFPHTDLKKFNLSDLSAQTAMSQPDDFAKFIHLQLERYKKWQREADQAYQLIPIRQRIALKTARDLHWQVAQKIEDKPLIIFERKVKPNRYQILKQPLRALLSYWYKN